MKKINFKKLDFITLDKKANQRYQYWLSNSNSETKEQLKKLTTLEINRMFNKNIKFNPSGLSSNIGIGSSSINSFTINHITRALIPILLEKKINKVLITTNNNKNKSLLEGFIKILKYWNIEVYSFEEFVQTQGILCYTLLKQKDKIGIYLDINEKNLDLKFFKKNGEEFDITLYSRINASLKMNLFEFPDLNFNQNSKTKVIGSNYIDAYYSALFTNIDFFSSYKTIVIVHSDAAEKNILRIKKQTSANFELIRSFDKKVIRDISSPTAFSAGYRIARRQKADLMITFNSSVSKMSIAIRQNKTFKFLSSFELGMLLISLKGKKSSIKTTPLIPNFLNSYFNKDSNENSVLIGTDYKFSLNNVPWFDGTLIFNFIYKKIFNNPKIILESLKKIESKIGFFYDRTVREEIEERQIKNFLNKLNHFKKMGELKILSMAIEINDDYQIRARIILKKGEIVLLYEKITNILSTYLYNHSIDYIEAYRQASLINQTVKNFIHDQSDEEEFESKKSIRKIIYFMIFTVGMLLITFTFVFDWDQVFYSFRIMGASATSPFLYYLFSNLILFVVPSALIFFWILKEYREQTKFKDIFIAFFIYTFFLCISPFKLFSIAGLVWYLTKVGYKNSELMPAIAINLFITVTIHILISVPMIIYGMIFANSYGADIFLISVFAFAGLFVWSGGIVFIAFMAYSTRIQNSIFSKIESFYFRFGLERQYINFARTLNFNMRNTRHNINEVLSKKSLLIYTSFLVVITRLYNQSLLFVSLNLAGDFVAGSTTNNFWGIFSVNLLAQNAGLLIPIPGGLGLSELFLNSMLSAITGDEAIAKTGTFIFRFFSLYLITALTTFPFMWKMISSLRERKKYGQKSIWVN